MEVLRLNILFLFLTLWKHPVFIIINDVLVCMMCFMLLWVLCVIKHVSFFCILRKFLSTSSVFIKKRKDVGFSQICFLHLLKCPWIFPFILLVYCIMLTEIHILSKTYLPEINPTWSWHRVFFYLLELFC